MKKNTRYKIVFLILIVLFLFIFFYFFFFFREEKKDNYNLYLDESDLIFGNLNSSKIIVEYASLQCSACAYFHLNLFRNIKEAVEKNEIGYIIRLIPLSEDEIGFNLVKMGYCSLKLSKSIEIIEKIYRKLEYYRDILSLYQILPNREEEFKKCLESTEAEIYLRNSIRKFLENGFRGVPSFLIFSDGKIRKIEGVRVIELD